jgi:hypothetical protein
MERVQRYKGDIQMAYWRSLDAQKQQDPRIAAFEIIMAKAKVSSDKEVLDLVEPYKNLVVMF